MKTKLSIFANKLIEAGWLAAVIAVPLFFNIYTARTFEPDKLTLMRSIVMVMILAWLIKVLEEGFSSSNETLKVRFKTWLKKPMILPTLTIVSMYIISTILSISPHVSFWGSYQRMQGTYTFLSYVVIFALMASNITTREQIDRFVTTVIIASIPVALYGIIQHNGLDPLPWAGDVTRRVASNMGNAIFVSSYLIMIVPLTLSRLIQSMTAIVTEEAASWGHTVLAAVYIFITAIQILTIIYSVSRGPQIGLLGAIALMGLLILMILRQRDENRARINLHDFSRAMAYVLLSTLAAIVLGGIGFFLGKAITAGLLAANMQLSGVTTIGAALGGAIGFAGVYTFVAASKRGWRWLWVTWILTGIIGAVALLGFLIALNTPNSAVANLAKNNIYLRRMAGAINTDSGTGKVRVLIWEGAFDLISPHRPLGVEGKFTDGLNALRPLIGYGPESMFNAFAFAYPTDLAHVENRGSSADRSHNETMDSLVITGLLGFLAFYFLMGSLFFYALKWLGWVPDAAAKRQLIIFMTVTAIIGAIAAVIAKDGAPVLIPVGLPFGLFGGVLLYLAWRAWQKVPENTVNPQTALLTIGLLGAFVGHFLEVHFVFSIAATYTYFWAYLGLMVAMWRIEKQDMPVINPTPETPKETVSDKKSRRRKKGQRAPKQIPVGQHFNAPESWETWLGASGLVMAIVFIILTFDFVPVQFDFSTGRYSLLWMLSITYLVGTAITFADLAVKQKRWKNSINWARAAMLFLVTSLGYAAFYVLLHSQQRHILTGGGITDALDAANKLSNILIGFYIALFLLMTIIAGMLIQKQVKGLQTWRANNWWLYPPIIAAAILLIGFKNINVVKADTLLKEGDRYRSAQQWNNAIRLHQEAIALDSDEDFYYLMLALDYQLEAQDRRLDAAARETAWKNGEQTALAAQKLNPYNPDNTGNMGRYYFTLGQVLDPSYFDKAQKYFTDVIQLAPQNVIYYNLLAQTYYVQGNYNTALEWLNKSTALDSEYPPTWLQLGDTYAAKSDVDAAAKAHATAITQDPSSFADANFDSRLNFYLSSQRSDAIINAFKQYITDHPGDSKSVLKKRNQINWAIGHIYLRTGAITQATQYLSTAINQGYQSTQALVELADIYLTQKDFEKAETLYQQALPKAGGQQQAQIWSSLGYVYANIGRPQDAINANEQVLKLIPNDYDSQKNLALLYQQIGDLDSALTHAQAALQVAPEATKADLQTYIEQLQAAKGNQ